MVKDAGEQSDGDTEGEVCEGPELRSFCLRGAGARCSASIWSVHQLGSSPNPVLLDFYGGFITQAQ